MKKILSFLCCVLPFFTQAQFKTSIDFISGIDYSYRYLSPDNTISSKSLAAFRDQNEVASIGMRAGANFNLKLNKKLYLKTGLRYVSNGYSSPKHSLKYESEYDPINGGYIPDPSLPHELASVTKYRFIEIPVAVRYVFGTNKLSYFAELGLGCANYINQLTTNTTDINKYTFEAKYPFFNHWTFNSLLSIGGQYILNKNIQLFAQPIYRYSINSLPKAPINEHLYNLGLEFGFRCNLNTRN
jgi:hypothetical protein